ncbi:MAG: Undecaprenyl-diphosphatase [Parcubacteria group bacterium GW2011_GWA2_36_10]|nr:MAG: Undecaprenyl-diphosphatase [Parcubacteria group bacterium GW2011_GWA2_36_10]
MTILALIILGLVQGVAEWLPISSDGHLVLVENLLKLNIPVEFDIFLHLGSLLVLLFFFRQEIKEIALHFFQAKKFKSAQYHDWVWYLLLSTLVTAIIGFSFYQKIDSFRTVEIAAFGLLVTSIFLFSTFWIKERRGLNWQIALILGLVQGIAVLPGVSRSALVISTALLLGLNKKQAFDFAFLLAIPAILGALVLSWDNLVWHNEYLIALVVTIISGYLALILLKRILLKNYFPWFFVYTLLLGLITLLAI